MRKRSLPDSTAEGRTQHKFRRPHVVPALTLVVHSAHFNLNVLICKPEFGDYHHWAVQLDNLSTGDGTIFEVQGAYPSLDFTTYQCRRFYYPLKIIQTIRIKDFPLSMPAFGAISQAIENQVPIQDRAVHWNCQDYVLDVLNMLEQEWWLEDDDPDYIQIRRKLKSMHGPMDLVKEAVTAYPASPAPEHAARGCDKNPKIAKPKSAHSLKMIINSGDDDDG